MQIIHLIDKKFKKYKICRTMQNATIIGVFSCLIRMQVVQNTEYA